MLGYSGNVDSQEMVDLGGRGPHFGTMEVNKGSGGLGAATAGAGE